MVDLYIYYRCPRDNASQVHAAARRLLDASLGAAWVHRTGLRWREDERHPDALTWMEIYEGCADPSGLLAYLEAHAAMAELIPCLSTARHVERFVDADRQAPEVIVCA